MKDENSNIIPFNSKIISDINIVGGKGYSLIKLTNFNYNVPPGIILTVEFFSEWMKSIQSSSYWPKLMNEIKDLDKTEKNLLSIIEYGKSNLKLSEKQIDNINYQLNIIFKENYKNEIYAIRSSSVEEDLNDFSFAGEYESRL